MKPNFSNLWKTHYHKLPWSPCECTLLTDNCALRMSAALNKEGTIKINSETYREDRCPHDNAKGAESLAFFLRNKIGKPLDYINLNPAKAEDVKSKLKKKQGIIFFRDCWRREGESFSKRTGDHIDLWLRGETKGYNDPENRSKQIWFWELV